MTDGEAPASPSVVESPTGTNGTGRVASLYADLAVELRRFVLGVTRDPDLADDVMQATFVKSLEHGHDVRPETARGWFFRVALHEALASRRRAASRDRGNRRLSQFTNRPDDSPDAPLIRGETVLAVREALRSLPEGQRKVILARVYEGKTFAQIAGDDELPLGTVLTRMRRGLEKLRKTMRPGG